MNARHKIAGHFPSLSVGRIFRSGSQPMNAQIAFYYNVASSEFGADWTLRVQLQLLFLKK